MAIGGLSASDTISSLISRCQTKSNLVARNAEAAGSPGVSQIYQNDATDNLGGVSLSKMYRLSDPSSLNDLERKSNTVSRYQTLDNYFDRVMKVFKDADAPESLGNLISNFKKAQELAAKNPADASITYSVVQAADLLAKEISSLGDGIQIMRHDIDIEIGDSVKQVNEYVNSLKEQNRNIADAGPLGLITRFQDEQDRLCREINGLLKIDKPIGGNQPNIVLLDLAGKPLLDPGYEFSYTPSAGLTALSEYLPDNSGQIKGITINGQDITQQISGGKIGALLELRDQILPNIQKELDEFTAQLRDNTNAIHNRGTGLPPKTTLQGTRVMANGATTALTGTGSIRVGVVDGSTRQFASYTDIDLTTVSTAQDLITKINTGLGTHGTASLDAQNRLVLSAANGANGMGLVSLGGTEAKMDPSGLNLGVSHYFGLNDFFHTGTSLKGDGIAGIAQTFKLRPDLMAQPGYVSRGMMNTETTPSPTSRAIEAGDSRILTQLSDMLSSRVTFNSAGYIGQVQDNFNVYAGLIFKFIGTQAKTYHDNNDSFSQNYQERLSDVQGKAGVSVLTVLQEASKISMNHSLAVKMFSIVTDMHRDFYNGVNR